MPIIFNPHTQQSIVARGERLGICKKLLLWIGFPVDVRSAFSEDVYTITRHHMPIMQLSDREAQKRRADAIAKAEEEHKKNPKPGAKPRLYVPKG